MAKWYDEYLNSVHWKRTRLQRLLKAELNNEFNVVRCQNKECRLWFPMGLIEIHHKNYKRLGKERMSDLAVLCLACHGHTHGHRRPLWWEEAKAMGSKMVTLETVRSFGSIIHIGTVMQKCLAYHKGIIPADLLKSL